MLQRVSDLLSAMIAKFFIAVIDAGMRMFISMVVSVSVFEANHEKYMLIVVYGLWILINFVLKTQVK